MPDLVPPGQEEPEIWFRAKRYGWGWGFPVHWKGWVFFIGWMVGLFYGAVALASRGEMARLWIFNLAMIALLIGVCWTKGDRPRWRWGDSDD